MSIQRLFAGFLLTLAASFAIAACGSSATPTTDPATVYTQAAETVAVGITQTAAAKPTEPPTNTPAPTDTPAPTNTAAAATQAPAAATNTVAAPTQASGKVTGPDSATFVADVTIPDGSIVQANDSFTKTWRVKNNGTTTWTTAYSLVYIGGDDRMGAPDAVVMPNEVKPGETVDLSVSLKAPSSRSGVTKAYFRLRTAGGQYFYLDGNGDLWVVVNIGGVATATTTGSGTATATVTPGGPTATPTITNTPELATPSFTPAP